MKTWKLVSGIISIVSLSASLFILFLLSCYLRSPNIVAAIPMSSPTVTVSSMRPFQ